VIFPGVKCPLGFLTGRRTVACQSMRGAIDLLSAASTAGRETTMLFTYIVARCRVGDS